MSESTTSDTPATTIKQVGGTHYETGGDQHWDLCVRHDVHYLLGCASKYVARHYLKGGRQDLEKAESYLERYAKARKDKETKMDLTRAVRAETLIEWAAQAGVGVRELGVLYHILCTQQHHVALERLRALIELTYPPSPRVLVTEHLIVRPGTPEDGGHHERAGEDNMARLARTRRTLRTGGLVRAGGMFPASVTAFEYDHRLDPGIKDLYTRNPSSCLWEIEEGWLTYGVGRD